MRKITKSVILFTCVALFLSSVTTCKAENPPFPGLPHSFWGTAKNQRGENLPDGTIIKATVDGENYYTTVMNGLYGWNETYQLSNPPFLVEDPSTDNVGKIIYFYVGVINTGQTGTFANGADTNLNLAIDDGSGNGGNGESTPSNPPSNNIAPKAHAGGPYFGCVNRTITFDGSNSSDSDGNIASFAWIFGDGSTGTNETTTHAYSSVNNYTVTLTVTDDDGLTDSDTATVYVYNDSDNDGWTDEEEDRYGTDPFSPSDFPTDTDGDYIPNIIDPNDDNDDLNDAEENKIGSDPVNKNDVTKAVYNGTIFYFVDTDEDGDPNIYYDKENASYTVLKTGKNGTFYVDVNNDSKYEYVFNPQNNTISSYVESQDESDEKTEDNNLLIYVIIIVLVVLVLLLIIIYSKKRGGKKE